MNQAEYLGELHQAITEYQGAVTEAGAVLRKRLESARDAFFGNDRHQPGHGDYERPKEAVR